MQGGSVSFCGVACIGAGATDPDVAFLYFVTANFILAILAHLNAFHVVGWYPELTPSLRLTVVVSFCFRFVTPWYLHTMNMLALTCS
jgi:hypothetical protein